MLSVSSEPKTIVPFPVRVDIFAIFVQMNKASTKVTKFCEFLIPKEDTTRVTFNVNVGPSHEGFADVYSGSDANASSNCRASGVASDFKHFPRGGLQGFPLHFCSSRG